MNGRKKTNFKKQNRKQPNQNVGLFQDTVESVQDIRGFEMKVFFSFLSFFLFFFFYFGSKIKGLGGNLLQLRQDDKLGGAGGNPLISLGPYQQIMLCHVEFHKKNVKDTKVLCFFFLSQCAIMSCQNPQQVRGFFSQEKVQGKCVYCESMDCQESTSKVPVSAVKC